MKNKNILPIGNKPLCWHIFDTLLHVEGIDEIYCYCSDEKIKDYIPAEVQFLKRDTALDGNLTKGFEIYQRFIGNVDADVYVLCHATSPFIKAESIESSLKKVQSEEYDSAFSAQRQQTFAWYHGKPINYDLNDVPRTQEIEPVFIETSAFFIFKKEVFTEHHRRIGYMPYICETDAIESIDIDEPADYEFAAKIANGVMK